MLSYNTSMLKYLTSHQYRQAKQELTDLQMFNGNFTHFKPQRIRAYVKALIHLRSHQEIEQCFSIFDGVCQKESLLQIVKVFCFLHIVIQEAPNNCQQNLIQMISKLLNVVDRRFGKEENHQEKKRPGSVQTALKWLKGKISHSKEKDKKQRPKSLYKKSQKDQILSKEDFLLLKIIKPYIIYLTKSISLFSFYDKCKTGLRLQVHELWIILRILKCMLLTTKGFNHAGRYFKSEFVGVVVTLKKIFCFEIHFLYPLLRMSVEKQSKKIEKIYLQTRRTDESFIKMLVKDYQLKQIAEIFDETSSLNEDLLYLFYEKYFYDQSKRVIFSPQILSTSSKKYDFLYELRNLSNRPVPNCFQDITNKQVVQKEQKKKSNSLMNSSKNSHNLRYKMMNKINPPTQLKL